MSEDQQRQGGEETRRRPLELCNELELQRGRVVLDANVYVSALIRPQGPPGQIIRRFLENAFEIVLSPAIVEETVRAFAYPKVRKYIRASVDPELWFEDVILLAQFVAGDYEVEGVSVDADDDNDFAAAVEGREAARR